MAIMTEAKELAMAIELSAKFHGGTLDKGGQPYVIHPMRVAYRCKSLATKSIAWLHDTVEDTPLTLDDLRAYGFTERVIAGVDAVTHRDYEESYPAFIIRCSKNGDGVEVKCEDLGENLDASRLPLDKLKRVLHNIVKYSLSLAFLQNKISEEIYLTCCEQEGIK